MTNALTDSQLLLVTIKPSSLPAFLGIDWSLKQDRRPTKGRLAGIAKEEYYHLESKQPLGYWGVPNLK
jgi:hypothetical protein